MREQKGRDKLCTWKMAETCDAQAKRQRQLTYQQKSNAQRMKQKR